MCTLNGCIDKDGTARSDCDEEAIEQTLEELGALERTMDSFGEECWDDEEEGDWDREDEDDWDRMRTTGTTRMRKRMGL